MKLRLRPVLETRKEKAAIQREEEILSAYTQMREKEREAAMEDAEQMSAGSRRYGRLEVDWKSALREGQSVFPFAATNCFAPSTMAVVAGSPRRVTRLQFQRPAQARSAAIHPLGLARADRIR
jgi:hypothetical protein